MLTWQEVSLIDELTDAIRKKHENICFPLRVIPILKCESVFPIWYDLPKKADSYCMLDATSDVAMVLVNKRLQSWKKRMRFTLAHELGHVVTYRHGFDYSEELCDEFAASLLMPQGMFERCLMNRGTRQTAEYFHVSEEAVRTRTSRLKQYHYHGQLLEEKKMQQRQIDATIFLQPAWHDLGGVAFPEPWVGI